MFPLLHLGPYALQVPGLILIVSFWLSLNVAEKEAKRQKHPPPEVIYGLVFYTMIAGLVGARLWYVGRYLDSYLGDPLGIIALNTNTLVPAAGLGIGLLVAILYGTRKRLPLRTTLDILAPGMAFFAIGLGLANLSSGNAFGAPTRLPWATYMWDENRHPTQVYETILAIAIFIFLWRYRKISLFPGFIFLAWLALAALARLFLEAFRGDSVIVADGIRQAQLVAMIILLIAFWLMRQWRPRPEPVPSKDPVKPATFETRQPAQISEGKSDAV